jgi:hypothetical protein
MCTKTVRMIDPAAARRRKERAARDARIIRFQEYSGNAALCGRELPPDEVLASSQHIDAIARALRDAGVPGTLEQLRVRVYLDLTQERDPFDRVTAAGAGPSDAATAACADLADDHADRVPDGHEDGGSGAGARAKAPVKAVINLLVPAGTMLGWSPAPGEIAGFGVLDPQTSRDMIEAASAHPETRWCVTVVGPDGTASAHGCAPGRHPWTQRDGPGPPTAAEQAAQVAELLRRLRVELAPIAKGSCDHRHYSDRYVISRKVKHLIKARAAKCTAPAATGPPRKPTRTIRSRGQTDRRANVIWARRAVTTTGTSRPRAGTSNSPNRA